MARLPNCNARRIILTLTLRNIAVPIVSLPSLPKDKEFEEYVAAFLQSSGYFVERSIIDRGEQEVLELDIITTEYSNAKPPKERLIEVKSGGWGFSEIFKLSGWSNYLKIDDVDLIVCIKKPNQEFYEKKAKDIGVGLLYHPNDQKHVVHSQLHSNQFADPIDVAEWRFSYWLERILLRKLTTKKKSLKDQKCYRALDDYFYTINSGIFFTKNVIKRADAIYDAYKKYPHVSAKVGHELEGKDFDGEHEQIPQNIFQETFYKSEFTDICISTYIEYRARLALLKAAVDFSLYEKHGFEERVKHEIEFTGLKVSLKNMLPDSFLDGLEQIKSHSHYEKYPVFWQHLLWLFGGFILDDYKNQDYRLLSMKTGVPIEEIPNALKAFDLLFPVTGGWFVPGNANSKITYLKMFSIPFMGIGANYRRLMYSGEKGYGGLNLTGNYTRKDLIAWNNLIVKVLT